MSAHAIIRTGGKQYRVAEGTRLRVETLDAEAGQSVDFPDVLLVSDGETTSIGRPLVAGAKVTATVLAHGRGPKIRVIKFKRRKQYRKQMGHRQNFTDVEITKISRG